MNATSKTVILVGGGGHGAVVAALARACGWTLAGVIDPNEDATRSALPDIRFLSRSDAYLQIEGDPAVMCVAVGIGGAPSMRARAKVYQFCRSLGYDAPALIHPFTAVAPGGEIGPGAQVMMGAVVQPRARLGENCIINTRASVDHDCIIGAHAHVAPGATLCGGVKVGEGAFIGAGATIIQDVTIGSGCVIGAGALVLNDVTDGARMVGAPARQLPAKPRP